MAEAPSRRVWTQGQLERAAELHQQGLPEHAIAHKLGLSRSTTRRLLIRAGRVQPMTQATADWRREQLTVLVRHLTKGVSLSAAADAASFDVQHARKLIRSTAELALEPLPAGLQDKANDIRALLEGDDVRAAARGAGIDPWFALFLLLATGSGSMSMQPQMQPETLELAARMAGRRAAGASFATIGAEFGMTHQRVRRILLATGGWTPAHQRRTAAQTTAVAPGNGTGDKARGDIGLRNETITSRNAKAAKTTATNPTAAALPGRRRKA